MNYYGNMEKQKKNEKNKNKYICKFDITIVCIEKFKFQPR